MLDSMPRAAFVLSILLLGGIQFLDLTSCSAASGCFRPPAFFSHDPQLVLRNSTSCSDFSRSLTCWEWRSRTCMFLIYLWVLSFNVQATFRQHTINGQPMTNVELQHISTPHPASAGLLFFHLGLTILCGRGSDLDHCVKIYIYFLEFRHFHWILTLISEF